MCMQTHVQNGAAGSWAILQLLYLLLLLAEALRLVR